MKFALIGCGRIAKKHIEATMNNNIEIAGLCDIKPELARHYAEQYTLDTQIFDDYRVMLDSIRPDFVAIATESGKHAKIALNCIDAGVNVIIEKPIALSIKDADEIIAAAKRKSIIVGVCHQNRFNRAVQKLRSAVDEGRFGTIFNISAVVRWNRKEIYYKQAPWRGTWELDGGCLMNQCIHNIDLLHWYGGAAQSVFGVTNNFCHPYIEAEDFGTAIVRFESGAIGTIEGTVNTYPKNFEETLTIFGEKGTAKLGGKSVNAIEAWEFADGKDCLEDVRREFSEEPPNIYGFGHTPLYADFVKAICDKREPYITAIDGKAAMEFVLAVYESKVTNENIKLPLSNCATTDFKEKKNGF